MKKRILPGLAMILFAIFLFGYQILSGSSTETITASEVDLIGIISSDLEESVESQSGSVEAAIPPVESKPAPDTTEYERDTVEDSIETENSDSEKPDASQSESAEDTSLDREAKSVSGVMEDGHYTSKEDVALYIHTFNRLPSNFITKKEAQALGWNNKENTMAEILPGMSIGGDHFGNYEGLLPEQKGRSYKECDIDYVKGSRNAKRIVFSNDGLIFYTGDHYNTFEQLY